jgi:hypothetical protein
LTPIPDDRRADGTGLRSTTPDTVANSNKPRSAAMRWFIVDDAAPRPRRIATTVPDDGGVASHSRKSNTSIGVTAVSCSRLDSQNRAKLNAWKA